MGKSNFICINGEFVSTERPVFTSYNRAFRYGDGIFESMRAIGTTVPFLNKHITRMKEGAHFLEIDIPESYTTEYFAKQIKHLLNANKQFTGARIRLGVYRKEGGTFSPLSNKAEYYIESDSIDSPNFQINNKGLVIDLYNDYKKSLNPFNQLKSIPSQLYIKAALFAQKNRIDDCILLNEKNQIIEASSSNIFIVSGNNILTPVTSEGCLAGIMREIIIQIAKNEGYNVSDNITLTEKDLLNADEIFLTNAVQGIKWVVAFRRRRYFSRTAKKLNQSLANYSLSLV